MRVTLGNFDLADHGVESCKAFHHPVQFDVQDIARLRQDVAVPVARGNQKRRISFTVSREHADIDACQRYILDHADKVPASGRLEIETHDGGASRFYEDAVMAGITVEYKGVRTWHTYELAVGAAGTNKKRA